MPTQRQSHRAEVIAFLQDQFAAPAWALSLPPGSGNETYFARGKPGVFFVKVGAKVENYRALAGLGLTPPLLADGRLADGTPLMVQALVEGRKPSQQDFQENLARFAEIVGALHSSAEAKRVLAEVPNESYRALGLAALARLRQKWGRYREGVAGAAGYVDESLARLEEEIGAFTGGGSVAGHNDICNANWLLAADGRIYLIDLESMAREDPALDLGALLWWYYPPQMHADFLAIAGGKDPHPALSRRERGRGRTGSSVLSGDERLFAQRMRVRMALHCLNILLPREGSFDRFAPEGFAGRLVDFRAVMEGKGNPQLSRGM